MKILFVVAVLFGFAGVLCEENSTQSNVNSVVAINVPTTNGQLNSPCSKNADCKGNGTWCHKITNICQCMLLLTPENGLCVNKSPLSHETIGIIHDYIDTIIGFVAAITILGFLFIPIRGRSIQHRIFSGLRNRFRHTTHPHNPPGPYMDVPLPMSAINNAASNTVRFR